MKTARKIIFIILAILPILPLICQVVSNIGNDNNTQKYTWGIDYGDGAETPNLNIQFYYQDIGGIEEEFIVMDLYQEGINDKIMWGLYDGTSINTKTFMGTILKTTYTLTNNLGMPQTPVWIFSVIYIIYLIFIEIIMLITDLTLLIPRKIKEWIN